MALEIENEAPAQTEYNADRTPLKAIKSYTPLKSPIASQMAHDFEDPQILPSAKTPLSSVHQGVNPDSFFVSPPKSKSQAQRGLLDELYSLDPLLEAHELRTFQRSQA